MKTIMFFICFKGIVQVLCVQVLYEETLYSCIWGHIHCLAKKSCHLDLTKQIGKSLLLDNCCMSSFLFHNRVERHDISLFEEGQITDMHEAEKISEEIEETKQKLG